ncbi:uncharacterized protein LOC128243788 [Mya arenaria]|uniref:uncharacterized protein LOC128243788 n=1 Tax=Mya arenaria TaxID=6604 RepID=UPI0022DFA9F2|nr:uncharacterized protein LOC128243788 [Mya arenaria]
MNKITDLIKARKYRFVEDPDTERLLGSDMGLGGLDVTGELVPVLDLSTVTWKNKGDINTRWSEDKKSCWITGSALLSPGLFLLPDRANHSVKLVDVTTRTVTSHLKLPCAPWAVCALPDDQAAVTLPFKCMIQLLSTQGGQLSCEKEIKVSSGCCGIAYYNNRLYVSYKSNPRIIVVTLDGQIVKTFQRDDGKQLFKAPYSLTVSSSTPPTLYVSDLTAHKVLQLSLDGTLLRKYRDDQLINPRSIVEVGPGQLLVCGQGSNNVMLLTEKDGKMAEILGHREGLPNPYTLAFCSHIRAIVVGMYSNDSQKVFNAN